MLSPLEAPIEPRAALSLDLRQAVTSKGYTPSLKQLPKLLALLGEAEGTAAATAMAIRRMGTAVLPDLLRAIPDSQRPQRGRLTELIGRFAAASSPGSKADEGFQLLLELLDDHDLKTQLNAAAALGRRRCVESEAALLAALAKQPRRELQLALIRALGKVGGGAAQAALAQSRPASDPSALQVTDRAMLILQREQSRIHQSVIADTVPLGQPQRFWLHARDGLEHLLADEARKLGYEKVQVIAPGRVEMISARALADLWCLRLMTDAGLPMAPQTGPVEVAVAAALRQAESLLLKLTSSAGDSAVVAPVRYRIDWPEASKAQLWSMAGHLMVACPTLVNDPTLSTWDLHIHQDAGKTQIELRPKRWLDPRFSYRRGFVPAASHPTIAAALARVAAAGAGDIVWDPFVGSGSELIECGLFSPVQGLYGTDSDPTAISVAQGNVAAANLQASLHLSVGDFSAYSGPQPSLIITNPPMGRRVQRGQLAEVLIRFAEYAANTLAPGGRLVWLAPLPVRTNPVFQRHGFRPLLLQTVDMGGFPAELQHLVKPM